MPTVDIISPGGAFTPAAVGDGVTDDAPAFRAFNVWAQAQVSPITLTLGSGSKTFLWNSSDPIGRRGNSPAYNVFQPLTVIGNGPANTRLKGGSSAFSLGAVPAFKSGSGFFGGVNDWTARVNSVAAGASQVTCKVTADAAQFSINTWALMTGIDMMAQGFPTNPFWFEYVYITGISSGVITFQSPLTNSYLDTWPFFSGGVPGLQADQGGPATLYALDPSFDIDVTYQDLGIENIQQTYAGGKYITYHNVQCFDAFGITPTNTKITTFRAGCDLTSYLMEADKLVERIVIDASSTGQLFFQSALDYVEVKNGSNISGGFNGTPRHLSVTGSTVNGISLGPTGFGRSDSFSTSGSTFTGVLGYGGVSDDGDNSHTGFKNDYTMVNGVITIPKLGLDYGTRWAFPGTRCLFGGTGPGPTNYQVVWGPMFRVISVTDDATNEYVTTDWPYGGFPSWASILRVAPSNSVSFASDTICSDATYINQMAATAAGRLIPGAYRFLSRNGSNLGTDGAPLSISPNVGGRLISLTLNVTTPYTGAQGSLRWRPAFDRGIAVDGTTITTYNPSFDLKTAGTRIITPSGVTGTAGADSNLALSSPTLWLSNTLSGFAASASIASEYNGNNAVGPVFTVELILDQGAIPPTAVAPLRLRLKA